MAVSMGASINTTRQEHGTVTNFSEPFRNTQALVAGGLSGWRYG